MQVKGLERKKKNCIHMHAVCVRVFVCMLCMSSQSVLEGVENYTRCVLCSESESLKSLLKGVVSGSEEGVRE
jgi:hypothetical protein